LLGLSVLAPVEKAHNMQGRRNTQLFQLPEALAGTGPTSVARRQSWPQYTCPAQVQAEKLTDLAGRNYIRRGL